MSIFGFGKSEKEKYASEARRCRKRGEFDRAGDYYFMAGEVEKALEMYVEGSHFNQAAQMLEKKGDRKRAAEMYLQARDLRAAADSFEKAGEPRRASQIYEKMGEFFKAAQLEEQLHSYRHAAELYLRAGHPDRAAGNFVKEGDSLRAGEALEAALAKSGSTPREAESRWTQCAELFQKAKRHRKAAEIWAKIGQHLKAAAAYESWGDVERAVEEYLKANEPERAHEAFRRAPEGAIDRRIQADLAYARGSWREAADLFREIAEPGRAAECYEKADEKVLAAEQYESAGDLELAADLLYGAGEHARASRLYERGMRHLMAARAADEAGETERAGGLFELAHEPIEAAKCWRKLGQVERGIEILQQVQEGHEGYTDACTILGELFRAKGLSTIAAEKYQAAIGGRGVDETTIDAHYGLAVLHEEQGEAARAVELFERIVAVSYTYSDAAERLDRLRKAAAVATTPSRPFSLPAAMSPATAADAQAGGPGDPMSASGAWAAAAALGRRYELIGRVGSSGRTDVYKAWDGSLNRTIVLKRLVPHDQSDEGQLRRYLHEAQQASKLHHSNIATIYDVVDVPEGRFIATEYVFGESLRDVLRKEGHLSPARTVEVLSQILLALEYAHENDVTHRNLRPENVLLSEKTHIKLTDFGMTRRLGDLIKEPYDDASPLHYLAPEQLRGEKAGGRADIYALGCMAYEMLVGRPPFTATDVVRRHLEEEPERPTRLDPEVPAGLEKTVLRCLEKSPEKRFDARQAYEELRAYDFIPGQRIADRYELLKELGSGGMGKVYLARDLELDERIAMKVLRPEFGTDTMLEQRFIREIKLARKIVHPSVVKVYDFGKWKNLKYITMEYIDGISLDEYVRRNRPPNVREVCRFTVQICEALEAAHRLGVVHRDIKPQNVLLSSADRRAKLVDFGIARIEEYEDLTSSRLIIGSPKYMSPEQISGKNIDHRTDIYSLGVVLYFCLTGIEPFAAEDTNGIIMKQLNQMPVPPSQVNPDLPPWLEMTVLKALVKDPRGRYQRAIDVSRDILARMR